MAISPRGSIRLEKEQKQPGTRRGGENSRRDLVLVENEARARVERLKCERKPTGWIWELYRGFVSRKRQENLGIESAGGRIWFGCAEEGEGAGLAAPRVSERSTGARPSVTERGGRRGKSARRELGRLGRAQGWGELLGFGYWPRPR